MQSVLDGSGSALLAHNETTAPTLKPLCVDRETALRVAGLFAMALGAWGLGAVTLGPRALARWPCSELDISNEPDG